VSLLPHTTPYIAWETVIPYSMDVVYSLYLDLTSSFFDARYEKNICHLFLNIDVQVRAAYRKKGWALLSTDHIEQCKHDEYLDSIIEQKGEGCRMWGKLEVSVVRRACY
jgi:hypothetical protein